MKFSWVWWTSLLACTAACGGASSEPKAVTVPVQQPAPIGSVLPAPSASMASASASAPEKAPEPLPEELAPSGPTACEYSSASGLAKGTIEDVLLRLSPDGPAFAVLDGGPGTLTIPVDQGSQQAFFRLQQKGYELKGFVTGSVVMLHLSRPLVLGGFLAPGTTAQVQLLSSSPGNLTVEYPSEPWLVLPAGPLTTTQTCDTFQLTLGRFDATTAFPQSSSKKTKMMTFRQGPTIPLSTSPAGPVVAELSPKKDSAAEVLEQKGKASLIRWSPYAEWVYGWVPTAALRPLPKGDQGYGMLSMLGTGLGEGNAEVDASIDRLTCTKDIPLIAKVKEQRATVGRILPRTPILIIDRKSPWTEIRLPSKVPTRLTSHASLWVRSSDLQSCQSIANTEYAGSH